MEKFKENVDKLNEKETVINFLTEEEEEELKRLSFIKEGKDEGIEVGKEIGKEAGRKEKELDLAKKMLEKNMSLEDVSEITGLSIDTLEKLKTF